MTGDAHLGWWTIHGGDMLHALRRTHAGENPDLVYAEMLANSEQEDYSGRGDGDGRG